MIIAVPTGVKVFNWIFTMFRGRVVLKTPLLWFLGFVVNFTIGGMAGVLLSVPAIDFQTHNSLFLVAHFHSMIIGGVLFGFFSAFAYWFPKFTGFTLNERLGRYAFWCWILGFLVAFLPLYLLGFMGATRRLDHYDAGLGWQPLFMVAAIGIGIISCGVALQVLQVIVSIRDRHLNKDLTGDPWNGRTLEWSTTSPPPFYNYAHIPTVEGRDPFWAMKQNPVQQKVLPYEEIHMPKNSAMGLYIGAASFCIGFGLIWHMFWLAAIGLAASLIFLVLRLIDDDIDYYVPVDEITSIEAARRSS
jgi:cytochrome o ubiquinol oxidase subunit 1